MHAPAFGVERAWHGGGTAEREAEVGQGRLAERQHRGRLPGYRGPSGSPGSPQSDLDERAQPLGELHRRTLEGHPFLLVGARYPAGSPRPQWSDGPAVAPTPRGRKALATFGHQGERFGRAKCAKRPPVAPAEGGLGLHLGPIPCAAEGCRTPHMIFVSNIGSLRDSRRPSVLCLVAHAWIRWIDPDSASTRQRSPR